MLLQILWTLESLAAELAFVWFQWHMDSNMGGNVVTLDRRRSTLTPSAGKVEVVGGLSTYVSLAHVFLSEC